MTSFSSHVDRLNKKRSSVNRLSISSSKVSATTSIRKDNPTIHSINELNVTEHSSAIPTNQENILFVYLDLRSQLLPQQINALRAINDNVHAYTDPAICWDFIQAVNDRIFFIGSTDDRDLIRAIHDLSGVEMIFLLSSNTEIDRSRLPKIDGMYSSFEELLKGLQNTFKWFEEAQMELFALERDQVFLWSQLWREEVEKERRCFLIILFVFFSY